MQGVFDININTIQQLNPQQAVDLVRKLLYAEARLLNIDQTSVRVPDNINASDDGVDAEITAGSVPSTASGIIKNGTTYYQVKAQNFNVSASNANKIVKKERSNEFKPKIKECFENNGTLVVVLTGNTNPDPQNSAIANLRNAIKAIDPQYENANIEIWRADMIQGFLENFPSIRLHLQPTPIDSLHSIETWSKLGGMNQKMVIGDDQQAIIDGIKSSVSVVQQEPLRIIGDPGVGKTRSTLEALKSNEYASLVVYAEKPSALPAGFLNRFLPGDNTERMILVVDECSPSDLSIIWNTIQNITDRIKLVTIYNAEEQSRTDMLQSIISPLSDQQIQEILTTQYNIPQSDAQTLSQLCSGSPRVAHIIGADVSRTGNVSIHSHDDIWTRYIAGGDAINSDSYKNRLAVLKWVSLFRRFGYDRPMQEEGNMIVKKIHQSEGIADGSIRTIIQDLKKSKILQGNSTLYITPKLLHVWLWSLWWRDHGGSFNYSDFIKVDDSTQLTQELINWFFDMLRYGKESTEVPKVVDDLLSNPLGDPSFLDSEHGSKVIQILASVDQEAVLKFIETRVNGVGVDVLKNFKSGRRGFVNALEHIAVTAKYFERSANALLKLAEAENESWSNNATGTFTDLFSNAPGQVAPTAASPSQRLPILKKAIESDNPEIQKIAVAAIDKGLESAHFTRMSGDDGSGLIDKTERWSPKTYGEWREAYKSIWELAFNSLATLTAENRDKLTHIMIVNIRSLLLTIGNKDMVIGWLNDLSTSHFISKKELIKEIVEILHYDRKSHTKETITKLEKLQDTLVGSGYESLVRRYAGMNIIEDTYGDDGKRSDIKTKILEDLAKESLLNTGEFKNLLPWLVTKDAENSYSFAFQLGKFDNDYQLLDLIVSSTKSADPETSDVQFLAGYLQPLRAKDESKWEEILDLLSEDSTIQKHVPRITWLSGMTDRAIRRIIDLSKNKIIDDKEFIQFGYGSSLEPLSTDAFEELIEYLLTSEYESIDSVILDYASFFYDMKKKADIPEDLGFRIITQPSLFIKRDRNSRNQMDDYYWGRVANEFLDKYPNRAADLARIIFSNYGEDGTITDGHRNEVQNVLIRITELDPTGIWEIVSPHLRPARDMLDWHITHWFTGWEISFGNEGNPATAPIGMIPTDILWKWIDENIDERAHIIASYVPKKLFHDNNHTCLAREVLVRYGNRDDVRKSFTTNNYNEGWSGERSLHYAGKLHRLLEFRKNETNANVLKWIDEYSKVLEKDIENARLEEERDDRS